MMGKRVLTPRPGNTIRRISIEGNIGAGKSTFLHMLKSSPELCFLFTPEPVDMWREVRGPEGSDTNLLDAFYQDPKRYAFTFQSYVAMSRIQAQLKTERQHLKVDPEGAKTTLHLMERSLFSDAKIFAENCHMSGLMSDLEMTVYSHTHKHLVAASDYSVDAIIYLRARPEVCHERVKERSRDEECGVGLDYLKQIHQRHEDWIMTGNTGCEVCVLDCDGDFEHHASVWSRHSATVSAFLAKLSQE